MGNVDIKVVEHINQYGQSTTTTLVFIIKVIMIDGK